MTTETKRLERLHLICSVAELGGDTANEICHHANNVCSNDHFDPLPEISNRGITSKLNALSLAGYLDGRIEVAGGPVVWRVTDKGQEIADAVIALDGDAWPLTVEA